MAITDIVKYLKGITGRKLFEVYPDLRQKLWKSEDAIRKYIENQSKSY